jgi:hypothetical protein
MITGTEMSKGNMGYIEWQYVGVWKGKMVRLLQTLLEKPW